LLRVGAGFTHLTPVHTKQKSHRCIRSVTHLFAVQQERAIDGCPALAVRRAAADNRAAPGWSLILPAGWASQFWQALVYNGARPAGQRDWRWAAAHQVLTPSHICLVFRRRGPIEL
jgi:hypothetical protein